jgi:phage head maturation protease
LGDVAINLASLQNPDAVDVPVLIDHNASIDSIAGKGTLSRVGDALHITGELTTATEAGRQISALMAEGYPLQMSVGMQANLRQTVSPETVNGQTMTVRHVFEQSRIVEVSFVPTGADPNTSAAQFSAVPVQPPVTTATMKGVAMTRTPEDQALIDSLQTQITTFTEQIASLQAAQVESATAARTAELGALFAELGRDVPADVKPYITMGADSFNAYAADLRANKPAPRDRALFSAQTFGKAPAQTPDAADKANALLSSVKKLAAARLQTA